MIHFEDSKTLREQPYIESQVIIKQQANVDTEVPRVFSAPHVVGGHVYQSLHLAAYPYQAATPHDASFDVAFYPHTDSRPL